MLGFGGIADAEADSLGGDALRKFDGGAVQCTGRTGDQ